MMLTSSPRRVTRLVIAAVVLSVFGCVLLVGGARSAGRTSGVIAFARADGIYVMHVDGSHVHRLVRIKPPSIGWVASTRSLAWSPDGKKLAYWMRGQIWVMNADGTHNRALVGTPTEPLDGYPTMDPESPTWSPDGGQIAYTNGRDNNRSLWVMNADGSGKHRVASLGGNPAVELDWSPSGRQFVFTRWEWGEQVSELNLMDADGTHMRLLPPGRFLRTTNPDWSPSEKEIAFTLSGSRSGPRYGIQIAVLNLSGHAPRRLTTGPATSFDPAWSPDGRQIAFVREPIGSGLWSGLRPGSEIYVMNANGTNVRRLTHNAIGEASPVWQPSS